MTTDIPSALRLKLGALNVATGANTPFGACIGASPATEDEATACIAVAREAGMRVVCAGGGTYVDALAPVPESALVLSSLRLNRIVEHQPENLVVTAEAGVTLAALQDYLRRHRQFLPVNPPDAESATLGGIVAAAATGPWRAAYGPVRDHLLEVRGVDGLARAVRGGARVVKNVAGYDLPKLYTGSRGTLAFFTQVTFKVKPLPELTTRLLFSAPSWGAVHERIAALATSDVRPAVIEVVRQDLRDTVERPSAVITMHGSSDTVQWQVSASTEALRGEGSIVGRIETAPALPRTGNLEVTVRVRPCDTLAAIERLASIGWRGAAAHYVAEGRISLWCTVFPDTANQLAELRAFAESLGGAATIERMPRPWAPLVDPWGTPRPDAVLGDAIKAKLDPDGVFGAFNGE